MNDGRDMSDTSLFVPSRAFSLRRGAVLLVFAIAATASWATGYWFAQSINRQTNATVALDISRSIDRVLRSIDTRRQQADLLAGQPCPQVENRLTLLQRAAPYVRAIVLVHDGSVYCSSLGDARASYPLSLFVPNGSSSRRMGLIPGTPVYPDRPVLTVFEAVGRRDGVLYLIEGAYLADLLARAEGSEKRSATLSVGTGTLASDNTFASGNATIPAGAVVLPNGNSMKVVVAGKVPSDHLALAVLAALLCGVAIATTVVLGYTAGFTPRQRILRQVKVGLRRDEFFVVYQPIVDVGTGVWVGAEALVRWQHPRWGVVAPNAFIRHVETSPIIAPFTDFVLRTALAQLGAVGLPDGFRLTVNLAPCHMELPSFPRDICEALDLQTTALNIVLEITERGLITSEDSVREGIARLKAKGVQFAIDDFGTENSNLALLQRFHFDYIKIDRCFIQGVADSDRKLIEGILQLAKVLGASVVAEGVDRQAQHSALQEMGIPFAQGYLYHQPTEGAAFFDGYVASVERWRNIVAAHTVQAPAASPASRVV
ncbi:diguanylate phosphodiesterase [Caballeronia udeis]|uniref:cyclic-guanylate-specific phosphodiesterase n=1 Tax=Caballeronia udeis TaxID=1232866 RepID=A0A158JQK0_9BURK|nr:EAL domain-containing protein [Caballeronia udeis]SAL71194.1 diguanylate phosphodiesterase [Caballeronia udeis]